MSQFPEWNQPLPALTTDQMREVDRVMTEDFGIALIQMMENAGRHLAALGREMLGGNVEGKSVVVLAGRGNNGGGGLVAARRMANWGARVSLALAAPPEEFADVPAQQLAIAIRMGLPVLTRSEHVRWQDVALVLDALVGYGLRGAPNGMTAALILAANASGKPILALDAPSGLDTTTGAIFDPCVRAHATLALALPKVGLLKEHAREFVGELYVADIGVPPPVYATIGLGVPNLFAEAEIVRIQV